MLNKKNMIRPNFPFAAVGFKNLGEGLGNILFNLCKEALVNDQNHKFAAKNSQKSIGSCCLVQANQTSTSLYSQAK